ncbi:MAG: EAL domain-containing protein [Gammaproteobacteria bacterium]|nr:EAL domain-containing protein [Gammaproteobacteria bacterium]
MSDKALENKNMQPSVGLDFVYTKIVVDFQNVTPSTIEAVTAGGLVSLREALQVDGVCIARFDPQREKIADLGSCVAPAAGCNPSFLNDIALDELPWFMANLDHLRVLEIQDTCYVGDGMELEGALLRKHNIGSVLIIGFEVRGKLAGFIMLMSESSQTTWDVQLRLLLKLIASSLASGLERMSSEQLLTDERMRNKLAMLTANDGMWDFDIEANTIWFSPRWKTMLGYEESDFEDTMPDWRQLVHPDDLSRVQSMLRQHLSGETELFESIHRMRHRSGEWRWMLSRAKATPAEDGRAKRLVGVELDITERKYFEDQLHREKERAQITLQSIGDGVITTDQEGRIEYLNPIAEGLTGWQLEDAAGRPINDVFRGYHEETCEPLENPLAVAMRSHKPIKSLRPTLLIRRDGNEMYIENTAAPIRDGEGKITGGVLVFHDVSESRELNRRLSYHTSHDLLTGLVNRTEFENQLDRALKNAESTEVDYALCYLDLDQFKMINDTCGHAAGDTLLGQLGQLLKSKIRWRDTLARLGGDEFALLLESCGLDEAVEIAETLRETVQAFKFTWDDRVFRLSTSLGVVPLSPTEHDVAGLLTAADSACSAAKESGRNRVHVFQVNDIDLMRRRREMQWAARISNALEESRFELFRQIIQPLNASDDGEHYELLLRMRDEKGKLISPAEFISASERYGLTPNIDRWVIRNAFSWLLGDDEERERLAVCSINLSGQSLGDDKFLPFVIERFENTGMDPRKICFEITETAAIASYSQANRFIHALRELGCRFALDDFGTGLSSFGYLKHFPVDYLKIDGSFVKGILHDPIDREMVRSINEIGHLTGKETIAEFAENEEIITMLKSMGVDYAQGYGVSEPRLIVRAA